MLAVGFGLGGESTRQPKEVTQVPRRHLHFEWDVAKCDEEWSALTVTLLMEKLEAPHPWLHRPQPLRLWSLLGLLVVIITGNLFWVWHTAEAGWSQIETELQSAVAIDEASAQRVEAGLLQVASGWTPGLADRTSQTGKPAPTSARVTAVDIKTSEVHGQDTVVRVVPQVSPLGEPVEYREMRFYHQPEGIWLPGAP
jgi:hypothetical protein